MELRVKFSAEGEAEELLRADYLLRKYALRKSFRSLLRKLPGKAEQVWSEGAAICRGNLPQLPPAK
jgi:hypothetical protein